MLNALSISAFASKKSFKTQWRVLNKSLLQYVKSDQFATDYKNADASGKLALLAFMGQVVDKFDLSIKALEGSDKDQFTTEEKLKLFQTMLKGYYDLIREWYNKFPLPSLEKETIAECLIRIHPALVKENLSAEDLRFSKFFDLTAFGSASGANHYRTKSPETLEDGFSAVHRELLRMLNLLLQRISGTFIPVPPLLKQVTESLSLGDAAGIELNTSGMTAHYTKTLREHGVQYHLSQPMGSEKVTLSIRFSAENEHDRWDRISHFVLFLKANGKFDMTDFEMGSRGVGYTFHLDARDDLATLRRVLLQIEEFSTNIADFP